jgi:hypothetical protein
MSPTSVSGFCDGHAGARELVLSAMTKSEPIRAWIVDDTGFPKKGFHSVRVARQYCGQFGKQDNCQVAVSLSGANERASLPVAYRLYLPKDWASAPAKARQGRRPGRRSVQDQASDRARPDSRDVGGRGSARRGSRRRGLWKRHALPLRPERKESRLIMSSASSRRSARGRPGQRLKGDLRI